MVVILEITPVERSLGEFGELANRIFTETVIFALSKDAIARFFEKSSEKR